MSPRRTVVLPAVVLLGTTVALTGCIATAGASEGESKEKPAGYVELPDQPWTHADEDTPLGGEDEEIPSADAIPEKLHVSKIDPIGEDEILLMGEGWGLEISSQVIDPATGEATAKFTTGPGIWDPVIHAFVGEDPDDPAVLAQEVWRPRGSRGAAEFTISTYSGDLLTPDEIVMPDYTRSHSRWGSSDLTQDGRYLVFWDDALYGPRVYDLEEGEETGALAIPECGPFAWVVERTVYSVCERDQELLELTIKKDGSLVEAGREKVLPADFVSNRHASIAHDAGKALLVSANGDVFVFDFGDGLPTAQQKPIGNAGQDSGRFDQFVLNVDATSMVISYTDSAIHPDSVNGGDEVRLIVSDPETFTPLADLSLESMKLASLDAFGYSVDGATLYVVGSTADEKLEIVGFDALTGAEKSRSTIDNFTDSPSRIITPRVMG